MAVACSSQENKTSWAFHIGNRGYTAFEELYAKVPLEYKQCQSRSDFWEAYDNLPKRIHKKCGKETGETSQVESVNNVIRQRLGRYVRKTCSFSKSIKNHIKVTGLFLQDYNIERLSVKWLHYHNIIVGRKYLHYIISRPHTNTNPILNRRYL